MLSREAGARVSKTRQAIIKAIRKGTISAAKDESGEWRIEPIELFRVHPLVSPVDGNQPATESGLRREIEVLRERFVEKDELIADLRQRLTRQGDDTERLRRAISEADERIAKAEAERERVSLEAKQRVDKLQERVRELNQQLTTRV
jgi:predicted  nucleic acid-binding Zn-ribbon protein